MKFLIVFVALFALAVAAPPNDNVEVLRQESDVGIDGFKYELETSDGTKQEAIGELKNLGPEESAIVVKGSYQFIDNDGVEHVVTYIADENGYQPQSPDIPVAPVA